MTHLYNCHTEGEAYRITKFDSLGNVESSYICTTSTCECPAGRAPTCRHRTMLPMFLARNAVNSFWFFDWNRSGWVTNEPAGIVEPIAPEGLPAGITMLSMEDGPEAVYNAIADAVGEPRLTAKPWRRI